MELIFATGNPHKLEEAREILGNSFVISTPMDYGITEEIPETSETLQGNAIEKARFIWDRLHLPCFADDTGLEVDFLHGAPGVLSARYAGSQKSSEDNVRKLLQQMEGIPTDVPPYYDETRSLRSARFRCVIALFIEGNLKVFDEISEGEITQEPSGTGGFGYDPVFRPEGYTKNFSELSPQEKNAISHRGKALMRMAEYLINNEDK